MVFPYTTLPNTPPRPYVSVILRNGFRTAPKVVALVDSGCDRVIFPMEIAVDFLQLDLSKAVKWSFYGIGKEKTLHTAKLADVRLSVLCEDDITQAFEASLTCAFCDTFEFPEAGAVLGREGFFTGFKITFYQPYKYFEMEPFQPRITPATGLHRQ